VIIAGSAALHASWVSALNLAFVAFQLSVSALLLDFPFVAFPKHSHTIRILCGFAVSTYISGVPTGKQAWRV
jgi:hypothetical protein